MTGKAGLLNCLSCNRILCLKGLLQPAHGAQRLFDINRRLENLTTILFHHMGPEGVARKNL